MKTKSAKKLLIKAAAIITAMFILCSCENGGTTDIMSSEDNSIEISEPKTSGRTVADFNNDWRFLKMTQNNGLSELLVDAVDFDDSEWESVTLPHTWNAVDGADGWSGKDEGGEDYYRGLGGYRKKVFLSSDEYNNKKLFIEFEGANTVTELFVNGKSIGKHEGGYSAFRFDITDYVTLDSENIIAVKVNNAPTDYIAPITNQGDFTKMGGIYRDVKLISVEPLHIDLLDYGSSGVYVTPKNISENSADINIIVKLTNDNQSDCNASVTANILDVDGNIVSTDSIDSSITANSTAQAVLNAPVENPVLWNGTKNPYLYTAEIIVTSDGVETDRYKQSFGIRTYSIDPENGFYLNGEYLDLRGVNYHQDSYENGWAMTNEQRERDYNMMLDMGCTSVRMAHYQHDSYEYELCDKLGLTVWTELGIVNKMSADETDALAIADGFVENAKQQLTELIRQNYNHPSIIVWGTSNELYQMSDEIYEIYTELNDLANKEDETRLITFADAQFWGRFLELPADVVGYNRYFGWYKDAGPVKRFGQWLDEYHTNNETRPICVSEYGGGAAMTQFKDNIDWRTDIDPWGERHYQNYQSAMHEQIWAQFSERQYLWGKYVWCMFDFASDGRQEGDTKGQNDKGLVTREREPKDSFYFYKSVWNDEPMLHLTEKGFTLRQNVVPQVKAYSNADSVELFVNDISQGVINRSDLEKSLDTVFIWENIVIDEDKENTITVRAANANGTILDDSAVWTGFYSEPEKEEENIALGKPVVYVSSKESGNPANGINDGVDDEGSRWCAASAKDYPASVIIDLEQSFYVGKVKTVTHKPGSRAYQFTVSISNELDGEYEIIADHSTNSDTSGYYTDTLDNAVQGRYLKIEVLSCSQEDAFPCIWELEAFENK